MADVDALVEWRYEALDTESRRLVSFFDKSSMWIEYDE